MFVEATPHIAHPPCCALVLMHSKSVILVCGGRSSHRH